MDKKKTKKDLDDKIKELEEKLSKLAKTDDHPPPRPAWMKEDPDRIKFDDEVTIGEDKLDTMKEISDAKKQVIARAGTVKTTEDGSVLPEDEVQPVRIPSESIHEFTNLEKCECECHNKGRIDCQYCYDHKEHLENKKRVRDESLDGYDEKKIMELIETDKAKKEKKHWWNR